MMTMKFKLGRILSTPGALDVLRESGQAAVEFLDRHIQGDWGDVSKADALLNEEALQDGSRIMSEYRTANKTRLWIITEAADEDGKRVATTILLPEEY